MKPLLKAVVGLAGVILVVLVAVVIYLSMNLNTLIVDGVETYGSQATQSRVELEDADLSFSGEGELSGLLVGNPKGYKAAEAFKLGAIKMALDVDSLTSDVIRIKTIDVVAPDITYEAGGKAGSNLKQLANNVQRFARQQGGGGKGEAAGDQPEKKMIIDRLTIRDGVINVVTPLSDKPLSSSLPTIELTDIGKEKGGASASEVVQMVMNKVTGAATKVANVSLDDLKNQLGKGVGALKDQAGAQVPTGVGDKAGEVGDKLKSLFK
jgi:uncharacterized protein involved in outer membrane biogenesis